jgi:hypothetical protein
MTVLAHRLPLPPFRRTSLDRPARGTRSASIPFRGEHIAHQIITARARDATAHAVLLHERWLG